MSFLNIPEYKQPPLRLADQRNPDKGTFAVASVIFTVPNCLEGAAAKIESALENADVTVEVKDSDYEGLYFGVTGTYTDSEGTDVADVSTRAIVCLGREPDVRDDGLVPFSTKDMNKRAGKWRSALGGFCTHIGLKLATNADGQQTPGGLAWPGEPGCEEGDVLTALIEAVGDADFSEPLPAKGYQFDGRKGEVVTIVSI